jgi:hypothetical protein
MIKCYYSYQDLADLLGQNIKTIKRKIAKMNIKSKRFGSSGHPRFSALDVHSMMLFNVPFKELNTSQKEEVKDLVMYAE